MKSRSNRGQFGRLGRGGGLFRRSIVVLALVAATLAVLPATASAAGPPVFINEIHYDNGSTDVGEAFEIAGPAGTDLSSYSVVLYNGNGGASYNTIGLLGTIPDQSNGFGTVSFLQSGIQNGSPDGLALVQGGTVVEFLSYEGSFTATNGDANGMTSTDIGVSEPGSTPVGDSLQKTGTGSMGGDFTWAASQPNTFGAVNTGQSFVGGGGGPSDPVINEFVANHTGADSEAFIEVLGTPSTDYSAYTLLEIEGDATSYGTIDAALPVGTTDAGGYWLDDEDMENGSVTILLVEDFTGSVGDDIDTDNDGTFDATPWTRIVDDVATTDGSTGDLLYSSTVLAAFFDGLPFGPGGASRVPNGTDTDTTADWVRNDFDGFGFPGFTGSAARGEAVNTPGATNQAITVVVDPVGVCGDSARMIHEIQGSGAASPDSGDTREVEGVVVGVFLGPGTLGGFNVQEEDVEADGDAATSEGIFVFAPTATVALGDVVRVRGDVTEFFGLTQINNVASVLPCGSGSATPATVTLPIASLDDYEAVEGMAVNFPQQLFVSGNFTQARFGQVDLSVGGPLDNPTNVVEPGADANALQAANNLSRIELDDGITWSNVNPPPYFDAGTLRTGDSVTGLAAVMGYSFGNYEIHPTGTVDFVATNPRPDVPDVGGSIQVAAYNVLNYFSTIDDSGPICGPNGDQDCRGADTADEFTRQRDKIITAIAKLDADVLGLMEIENHATDDAVADLVAGLNAATAPGKYAAIETGSIGDDAIKVALLYQPAAVTPLGDYAVLDGSVDGRFNDEKNRPMLTQSFTENASGAVFTTSVNHLKSKGSNCNDLGDPDAGDGQGNCNLTRTSAAEAIVDWIATDPTGSGDPDHLIIGDLNAYAKEDPIDAIKAGGYTDLIKSFVGEGVADGAYSFNFFSQSGYLDHGLASPEILQQVTGADFWHVNADEPSGLDYNNFNQASLYSPDEFRSSDHDPVVIGLDLDTAMDLKNETIADLGALLPTGDAQDDFFIEKAITRVEQSLNTDWWVDESNLAADGGKVFDREFQAVQELEKVSNTDVQAEIDQIVLADFQLAWVALTSAEAAGGSSKWIDRGWDNMAVAADHLASGADAKAVNEFKKAWQNAMKA